MTVFHDRCLLESVPFSSARQALMVAPLLLMRSQKAIRGAEERESRLLDCCQSVGMVWAAKTPHFVFFGLVCGACRLVRLEIASKQVVQCELGSWWMSGLKYAAQEFGNRLGVDKNKR